jgi:hypothetical protein
MATVLERAQWAYNAADKLALAHYPYVLGGGHGVKQIGGVLPPTSGDDPHGPRGYDCSAWVSSILWHGGMLESEIALDTHAFEHWGRPGEGRYVTVWVHDDAAPSGLHHCFLELRVPGRPHHWSAARHTGTICGWQDKWDRSVAQGYTARSPK